MNKTVNYLRTLYEKSYTMHDQLLSDALPFDLRIIETDHPHIAFNRYRKEGESCLPIPFDLISKQIGVSEDEIRKHIEDFHTSNKI